MSLGEPGVKDHGNLCLARSAYYLCDLNHEMCIVGTTDGCEQVEPCVELRTGCFGPLIMTDPGPIRQLSAPAISDSCKVHISEY